jgi:hypothetical protein
MRSEAKPADSEAALLPKEVGAMPRQLHREAGPARADVMQAVIVLFAEMELRGEFD